LTGELSGYRSVRGAGQRYRIIYRIEKEKFMVWIVALGIRKEGSKRDIYALAKKLLKLYLMK
jgi:mRNA interferase RelE/StbE